MSNTLTGTDKSVILLMTIGEDRAAEVFKHLSQREVQILSAAMANVRQISNKQLTEVLSEFEQEAEQFAALNVNANDYLRSVLVKALGEERAASLLEDILETRDTASGIETLNFMEPQSAADLIRDEHPQIIATILVHLKRGQAADILALFEERLRHDVMLRIATFGGVQPAALAELTEVLNNLLDGQNLKRSKMGGVRTAAEIINLMKTQQEEAVITAVREFDGELAQKIIDEMFLFENRSKWTTAASSVCSGSGLRVAAYRPQRCRTAAARSSCATCPSVRQISCATTLPTVARCVCLRWKTNESDPAHRSSSGRNRRDGNWQRRRYLCLMSCRGSAGRLTIWPLPSEFTPAVVASPEEGDTDVEAPELSEEEQRTQMLAQLQMQAHEQGFNAGLNEGRQKGHDRGYQEGLAKGLEQGIEQARQQQAPLHARMQQLVSEFQHTGCAGQRDCFPVDADGAGSGPSGNWSDPGGR